MNRLQNVVLAVWAVLVLLFVAFNWKLIGEQVDVSYLFMDFRVKFYLWMVLVALGVPAALRILAEVDARTKRRRADRELHLIKSKAFDGLTGEFDKMVRQLQEQLGERIHGMLSEHGFDPGPPAAEEPEEGEDAAMPALSAETAATLDGLDAADEDEEEPQEEPEEKKPRARAKPKRRAIGRKSKK